MPQYRKTQLARAAVAVLVLLAGCQTTSVAKQNSPFPVEDSPAVNLSAVQVSDMQVAMAQSLEKRGEIDQAKQGYLSALQKDPKSANACVKLATLHARRGEFTDAASLYHRALELEPNNADIYCNLGYTLYLQEQWVDAEASLRLGLKLQPDHKRAHNNLGLVLARRHQADEALAEFRMAGCGEADARLNLAYAQTLARDFGEAQSQYEKVLALDPSSEPARKGLERVVGLTKKMAVPAVPTVPAFAMDHPKDAPPPAELDESAIRLRAVKEEERRSALQAIEAAEETLREPK